MRDHFRLENEPGEMQFRMQQSGALAWERLQACVCALGRRITGQWKNDGLAHAIRGLKEIQ